MKKIYLFTLVFLLIASVSAANLEVKKTNKGSAVIAELDNPAIFDFEIKNSGKEDNFEIYSLISIDFWPKGIFKLPTGTKTMEIRAIPAKELRETLGPLRFNYEIRGTESGIFKDVLVINIVSLENSIEIEPKPLHPKDTEAEIIVRNIENTHIEDLEMNFDSAFFSHTKKISLDPLTETTLSLPLNKDTAGLSAGPYIVSASIPLESKTIKKEGIIDFLEKEGTSTRKDSEGFIIKTTTITKTNHGNIPTPVKIELKKDIISRLFTTNTPNPLTEERKGLSVHYSWKKTLQPGDSLIIQTTTNYTFPFIILIAIIAIAILVRIYTLKSLSLNKKTSFVRTKHGEFALKVILNIKARKNLKDINVIDMLPRMTKLYEKFGKAPDKVDPKTKRLFWNIPHMSKGEKRVISYIIYSKMNVLGRFELGPALATFKQNKKHKEVLSNKAYFAMTD